jgi:hypothetical protein
MLNLAAPEIGLNIAAANNCLNASHLKPAVAAAAKIGEDALRAEVGKLGRVTGNLADSISTRLERTPRGSVSASVGFFGGGAPHAHLVEFGTAVRYRSRKTVSSSWKSRGQWVGVGVYPANFVTRAANLGAMPAFHPLANARRAALESMVSSMDEGLAAIGQKAIAAAVS